MGKKREHASLSRGEQANFTEALAGGGHDYIQEPGDEFNLDEFPPLPVTPAKSPAVKKKACEVVNSALVGDIHSQLSSLTSLINNRSDAIESKSDAIESKICDLNDKIERVYTDLKDVSLKMSNLEKRIEVVERPVKVLQQRMDDLETYTRRWNLKLLGVPESNQENVRGEVIKICQAVLPSMKNKLPDTIDIVHRLGKKRQSTEESRPRGIILQFISRVCRDEVWRAAKNSPYLKEHGFRFQEDFSKGDREKRQKLWPEVEKARAAGKKAFFAGSRAFIEGEGEIILSG